VSTARLTQGCWWCFNGPQICDMPTLRERVLADEVSLAADVWDVEPLPLTMRFWAAQCGSHAT